MTPSQRDDAGAGDGADERAGRPVDGQPRYVHRPSGEPAVPGDERTFDWRGWSLVVAVAFAFLVVPGSILVLPAAQGFVRSLGLSLRDAYLTLPLVPAFLLGAIAVWSALRSRSGG